MENPLDDYLKNKKPNSKTDAINSKDELDSLDMKLEGPQKISEMKREVNKWVIIANVLIIPFGFLLSYFYEVYTSPEAESKVESRLNQVISEYRPVASATKPTKAKDAQLSLPSIDEAYLQTNVVRVKFDSTQSNLAYDDKIYLEQLFRLTDKLVVERVYNYSALTYNKPLRDIANYDDVLAELERLKIPASAKKAHKLIVSAVKNQRDYFKLLKESGGNWAVNAPLVQKTHSQLLEAWQVLLTKYDYETGRNKHAFEKHLCALDFI